jgi:hypothetical protein
MKKPKAPKIKTPEPPKPKPEEKQATAQAMATSQQVELDKRNDQLQLAKGLAGPRALLGSGFSGFRRFFGS